MAAFNSMELYLILLLLLSFTTIFFPSYVSSVNRKYEACSKTLQSCGSIFQEIGYPFYDGSTRPDYCGHPGFKLDCQDPPQITISGQAYNILKIDTESITVSRTDSWVAGPCPTSLVSMTMDFSRFSFSSADQNITFFYGCDATFPGLSLLGNCNIGGSPVTGYYLTPAMLNQNNEFNLPHHCNSSLVFPILNSEADAVDKDKSWVALYEAYNAGFELGVITDIVNTCNSCTESDGECGYNWDSNKFVCHCADADYDISCGFDSPPAQGPKKVVLIIGVGLVVLGFLILFSFFVFRKCKPPKAKYAKGKSNRPAPKKQRVEDMLKNYESLGPRRYTYANITKMTNSFREKLGEGGYGTVFKGKLEDGRVVEVKVWKQCKGDGHEFANEVVSIGSTSHINVVPLLGFCFEGPKGALIYEFMPNGSLEKFIRKRDVNVNGNGQALSFHKLFEIAMGIARGLEYLHRDCNTRIVHFDIKPHNILLDAEFTPKISDFGLAKAFKKQESIISISGARGTAGYIAPEVFFSSFGGVSHKSDVYSYGMMVLEMVGCTKRTSENVENSSELYFPRWIYKQLERETTLDCAESVLIDEDKELERKMVLVGLWCIQTNPMSRPSICRVVAMLEGEAELVVPPMPSLASPPRQQQSMDDDSATFPSSDAYLSSNN